MSHRSSDSWEDLSFPEISTESLYQDEPKDPVQSVNTGGSTSQIDTDASEKNEFAEVHLDTLEKDSDSGLWEEFSDIQTEDLLEVELEIPRQIPASSEKISLFPPLYFTPDSLFDEAPSGDIEEGGMSAGNLFRKYKPSGRLSVTDLVQPLWYAEPPFGLMPVLTVFIGASTSRIITWLA
jgi:hypothetical protein